MADHYTPGSIADTDGITLKELLGILFRYRFLMGLIILAALAGGGTYLFLKEQLYRAQGAFLVESPRVSILMDHIGGQMESRASTAASNDAVIRLKGAGVTDSVIVKTALFAVIDIPRKYYSRVQQFSAIPTPITRIFTVEPSPDDSGGFLVRTKSGRLYGKGRYDERFDSPCFSLVISDIRPLKSVTITLQPVKKVRREIAENLKTGNIRDSNVIRISFTSPDPSKAKSVVNCYLNELSGQDLLDKREKAATVKTFLEKQLKGVSSSLENTENSYLDAKMSNGIVSLGEQTAQYIDMMRNLEERRIDCEGKLEEAVISAEKGAAILKGDPELQGFANYASSPFIQNNIVLHDLYTRIATLQVKNAKLKSQYNPSHPLFLQSSAELDAARKQLDEAVAATVNNATKGVDPLLRPVVESQLMNRINVTVYKQLLSRIKGEIAALNRTLERLPRSEIAKARYDRNMGINSRIHNLLLTRLEEARIMEASTISDMRVVDWAETPLVPVSPRKWKVLPLSLLGGILVSIVLIFGIEHFNPSFSSAEKIESEMDIPVLALIPRLSGNGSSGRRILVDPLTRDYQSPFQVYEIFNSLFIHLMSSKRWTERKVIVISSAYAREGKSVVAANLAVMAARSGRKVLLIDCDFRSPVQHTMFKTPNSGGFADFIRNGSDEGIVSTEYPNLSFIPSGKTEDDEAAELFHSPNLSESVRKLEHDYDLIVIDSPPLMLFADSMLLSSRFRNVLLVVKSSTNKDAVLHTRKVLRKVNARVIGIVVNGVKRSLLFGSGYEEYGYGYGYGHYGYESREKETG